MKRRLAGMVVMLAAVLGNAVPLIAGPSVTVYNDNLGLVRETRVMPLRGGIQRISLDDVASQIDPTSVSIKALGAGRLSVLEQNYEYDLINPDTLLQKYIGKPITLERRLGSSGDRKETIKGTLLSTRGGIVMESDGRIVLNPAGELSVEKLPEGLILKPTLSWTVDSAAAGKQEVELAYLTGGIHWSADYVAVLSGDDRSLDLTGWVTLNNTSGATYPDAKLTLMAGDVNRVRDAGRPDRMMYALEMQKASSGPQFEEKSFFEYHRYDLSRPTTIRNNEIKQIELTGARGVAAQKTYVYDGARSSKVAVTVSFKNATENHLGIPLPKGRIRVYKHGDDAALAFVGEDSIDHTPTGEKVRVSVGNAFDITGERTATDRRGENNWREESYRVSIRNHSKNDVTVCVTEHLAGSPGWKILQSSQKYEKKNADTIEYTVQIPADGEKLISYTVRYSW